jgi:hypothetical protein
MSTYTSFLGHITYLRYSLYRLRRLGRTNEERQGLRNGRQSQFDSRECVGGRSVLSASAFSHTLSTVAIVTGVVASIRLWVVPPKRPELCARMGSLSSEPGGREYVSGSELCLE